MDDVSLDIEPGETLGLVGESGSGKSTLGRLILRLIEPTSGAIRFGGNDLLGASGSELRRYRRDMQIIFQDPFGSLDPRFRVEDVIAEPLIIHENLSREARRQRVTELLRAVGLDESAMRRYPHEFSGGQRQRLAIARALIINPGLLVLDEPTSALDVTIQKQVLTLLQRLQYERGLSYLLITHDVDVIRAMAHDVMVMKDGEVLESGAVFEVLDAPHHPYTRILVAQT